MSKRNKPCPCGSNFKYKRCCGSLKNNNDKPEPATEHYYLGRTYLERNLLNDAIACFREAIKLKTDFDDAYVDLGTALYTQGKAKEAICCYQEALSINPSSYKAHFSLIHAYFNKKSLDDFNKKSLDKGIEMLHAALKVAPEEGLFSGYLIQILNDYMPDIETDCPYFKAQKSLQKIRWKNTNTSTDLIADETVRQIYQKCLNISLRHQLNINTNMTQLFRGECTKDNCYRHKLIFNKFNIIPEYCFDCYKVTIEPRTVMELFKLFLVFDELNLPNNNNRKCIVEIRPEVSGNYKGFIYCRGIDEGKKILDIVQPIIEKSIAKEIPIFVKRGCSEFSIAYPAYGHISDEKKQQMTYNEEWREHEVYADNNLVKSANDNPNNFSCDHPGFTLLDTVVMRRWLEYAEKIGDKTYLDIN